MKQLSKHHKHLQALMTALYASPVEHRDRFAKLFPEYEESDREATDFNDILLYFFAAYLRGEGEPMNMAAAGIQVELGLAKNAVDARLKSVKDMALIRTVVEPGARDRRERLGLPTDKTKRRFVRFALYMAAMQIELGKRLEAQLAGFPLPELPDGLYDPFEDGISPKAAEELAQYLELEEEEE